MVADPIAGPVHPSSTHKRRWSPFIFDTDPDEPIIRGRVIHYSRLTLSSFTVLLSQEHAIPICVKCYCGHDIHAILAQISLSFSIDIDRDE